MGLSPILFSNVFKRIANQNASYNDADRPQIRKNLEQGIFHRLTNQNDGHSLVMLEFPTMAQQWANIDPLSYYH